MRANYWVLTFLRLYLFSFPTDWLTVVLQDENHLFLKFRDIISRISRKWVSIDRWMVFWFPIMCNEPVSPRHTILQKRLYSPSVCITKWYALVWVCLLFSSSEDRCLPDVRNFFNYLFDTISLFLLNFLL